MMAPCSSRVPVVRNPLMPVPVNVVKVRRIVHGELAAPALSPVGIENREIPSWSSRGWHVSISISLRCAPLEVRSLGLRVRSIPPDCHNAGLADSERGVHFALRPVSGRLRLDRRSWLVLPQSS